LPYFLCHEPSEIRDFMSCPIPPANRGKGWSRLASGVDQNLQGHFLTAPN
jgi:hypothetical protein